MCKVRTYHFHHFWIVEVVDDVFEDVSVRHEAEGSEHDDDRDLLLDVRQDGHNPLTDSALLGSLQTVDRG